MGLFRKITYYGTGAFVVGDPIKAAVKKADRRATAKEILALEAELERQRAKQKRREDLARGRDFL